VNAPRDRGNRSLAARLVLMAAASFAFGFALVPLYDVFCEVTGIGSRDGLLRAGTAADQAPVADRTVVVEFTASVPAGGWTFEPVTPSMEVQPGRLY
jgi:cytochrome c oxidase assembly protein subunit 11